MRFLSSSLLTLLLTTTSVTAKPVPELGLDNFETVISSNLWTCLLFYDKAYDRNSYHEMMSQLDDLFVDQKDRVGFAMMDIRANPYYRAQYKFPNDPHPFIHRFYTEFPDRADDSMRISHRTFMNLKGDLYWPSRIAFIANDFNSYGELDLDFEAQMEATVNILHRWLEPYIVKDPENFAVLIASQVNQERARAKEQSEADNSFDFDTYFAKHPTEAAQPESKRFLLESGVYQNPDHEAGYYRYSNISIASFQDSEDWLVALSIVITKYLTWVEGYETTWSEERRAREDEQTNFGAYLQELNDKIRRLLDRIFNDPEYAPPEREMDSDDDEDEEKQAAFLARARQVPSALKQYVDEMVFDYGRTPASLRWYLNGVLHTLGATPEERRQNRKTIDATQFQMFQRMAEYMKINQEITKDSYRYLLPLADLVSSWHNYLVEFQENINRYYVQEYLPKHPLEKPYKFNRKPIPVVDMEDPKNRELLSDYDAFNQQFTVPSRPVILGNANMTNHVYTLEYLVEQCGSMDVTSNIRVSNPVGQKSSAGWGGLTKYQLDRDLMTESRIQVEEDEDGDRSEVLDRSITLEQFVTLSEKLGTLYLHDFSLPDECDRLLYEETLYGEEQKFRIPSVVAAYDIFNRVTLYNYERSWPSLFIGKKGSNSKVHVDSGGSGFFMYLVSGRKRWMVYNPTERPFLYDRLHGHAFVPDVLGMDKTEEANEFLSSRFPLLHRAEDVYEVVQEPGQLIYIPPDSPHAVENLDDIVGVALNMGPREGLANHLHDQIHNVRKFGYTELALKYWLFEDNAQKAMPTKDPLYMTFGEYKAQY